MKATTDFDADRIILADIKKEQKFLEPIRCNHLVLIFCRTGEITIEINYKEYTLREKGILTIHPLDIVNLKSGSEDFISTALMLPASTFTPIMREINISHYEYVKRNPVVYLVGEYYALVEEIFKILEMSRSLVDYSNFEKFVEKQIAALFYIQKCYYTSQGSSNNVYHEGISRKKELFHSYIKELVNSHSISREVLFYANELGVSCGYLNEVCNEVSRHSAKEIIDSTVAARLKYELSYTAKSIQEIADEYNFLSQSYFSRYFKRLTGVTPSDFRKGRKSADVNDSEK